jgi:adenylate cyclase
MNARFALAALALVALAVYLGVSAPPPLPDARTRSNEPHAKVDVLFRALAAENATVRALYTTEIVGPGKQVGLRFDEHWKSDKVQAGPLPALFLRESALALEKSRVRVGLFLGSDFPLNPANAFKGEQARRFEAVRSNGQPQFFFDAGTSRHTAMFPDRAVGAPCVDCHNGHPRAPKTDFRVGDIMGATTWTYPERELSLSELVRCVAALRQAYRATYERYLQKSTSFEAPPTISRKWPREGNYLPDADAFMDEYTRRASDATLGWLETTVAVR